MKVKPPEGYEKERKAIIEKYEKKFKKGFIGYVLSWAALFLFANFFSIANGIKSSRLERNYPIYQIYIDNQSSLSYLNKKRNQYKHEKFPEFLSKEVRNELEKISIQENSAKISSLEKAIKIAEQDKARITNTSEFKEYSEKREKIDKDSNFYFKSILGTSLALVPGFFSIKEFYRWRGNKKIKALREKYGVIQSSQ
jgi:hypothetical protein